MVSACKNNGLETILFGPALFFFKKKLDATSQKKYFCSRIIDSNEKGYLPYYYMGSIGAERLYK